MNVEQKANATLSELLINRVQQLIIDNEEERIAIRAKSGITGSLEGSEFYRPDERAQGRIKQLTRDLGALLTTDEKSKEALIKELDQLDLINNPGDLGAALSKHLKAREGKEIYYKKVRDMTVGHHPTATNILRDALAGEVKYDENFNIIKGQIVNPRFEAKTRQELIEISKKNNYLLGDNVIAYIDPAAHKEFTTELKGLLGQRLNLKNKKDLEQFFNFQELLQRSAHARAFGGTQGIPLPKELLTGKEGAEQIFRIAKPYLDLAKAGTAQGLDMHALLKNTDWSNPEDLLKVVQSAKIPNTDKLLQSIYESQINNGIKPSGRLISAFTDPSNLLDKHKSIWNQSRKGVVPLDNIATKLDLNKLGDLDLSLGTQSPIAKGSTKADLWSPSGIFQFSGDGAGALTMDRPGLLSGTIQDVLSTVDKAIPDLPDLNVAKARAFGWMVNKGPQKFLQKQANELVFSTPFSLLLDKDLRQKAKEGDYVGFGTKLVVDHAIGEAAWHGGKYTYGLLPQSVRTIVGQGTSFVGKSLIAPLIKPAAVAATAVIAEGSFNPVAVGTLEAHLDPQGRHPNDPDYYKGPKPDDKEINEEEETNLN